MASQKTVVIPAHGFPDVEQERRIIEEAGFSLVVGNCQTPAEIIALCTDASALLVQFPPMDKPILDELTQCKIIVRYGVGVNEIDVEAATARGIAVCNVPDYGLDEVADHALSLALALARQLPQIDKRVRGGMWKMTPDTPMPAFREMTFAVAGFGRIGREVLARAKGFKFRLAAYDPFVPNEAFEEAGIARLSLDGLFAQADVLSLHLPLSSETQHVVNAARLQQMKPNAILVNTARGALVDTFALAEALQDKQIAAAALDVYEDEPPSFDHPIFRCENALLTSHVAWYSESSQPRLQRLAAEEIVRGLRGEPLRNQVNR